MNVLRVTLFLFSSLWLISCNSTNEQHVTTPDKNTIKVSKNTLAAAERAKSQMRKEHISDVQYQLSFDLTQPRHFKATSIITFQRKGSTEPLLLDLEHANIRTFIINGHTIYPRYDGAVFILSPSLLQSGENRVEVTFARPYSKEQQVGLVRDLDPIDGEAYIHSNRGIHWARTLFASFDQPDLKASYRLNVLVPKAWTVVSTMKEQTITEQDGYSLWQFPETPSLSSHSLSLYAGPYRIQQSDSEMSILGKETASKNIELANIENKTNETDNAAIKETQIKNTGIKSTASQYPLRLITRQSFKQSPLTKKLFADTSSALASMEAYLDTPYPFSKFDILVNPKHSTSFSGTVNQPNLIEQASIANVGPELLPPISGLHESKRVLMHSLMDAIAAQWIGVMVTQDGGSQSWLSESLRKLLALQGFTQLGYAPDTLNNYYDPSKAQAYEEDVLQASHSAYLSQVNGQVNLNPNPIHLNSTNLGPQKGQVTLLRLAHLVGHSQFKKGIEHYLKQHAFGNASSADFFASQSLTAKRSLAQWQQDWLYTPGVNLIEAKFSCQDNRISKFAILQSPAHQQVETLREQNVNIALYTQGRNAMHKVREAKVHYQGAHTDVSAIIGARCPDLVYPNYGDLGYVKVSLDTRSLNTLKTSLYRVQETQLRSMIWQTLWESVSDGTLPLNEYLGIAFINLPQEIDLTILAQVLRTLEQSKTDLEQMLPSHGSYIKMALKGFEQMSLRKAMVNSKNAPIQQAWFDAYIGFAKSTNAQEHLAELLAGRANIKGLTLTQAMRWKIIIQLNRYDYLGSRSLIAKETKQDNSLLGAQAAIAAEVSRPEAGIKRYWLTHIQHDDRLLPSNIAVAMRHLYPKEQQRLSAASSDQRLESLSRLDKSKRPEFMGAYSRYLVPTQCSYAGIATLENIMANNNDLSYVTQSELMKVYQSEVRCVTIKENLMM